MATIKAQLEMLSNKREDALASAKQILEDAENSTDGLTEELQAKVDDLTASAEETDGKIKDLLAREQASKVRLEKIQSFADHGSDIASARGVHVPASPQQPRATTIPATVRRYANLKNFTGEVCGMSAEERAYRFGQYALAKLTMDMPGRFAGRFQAARQFAADQFGMPLYNVHGEGSSDTSGAHVFVPEEFGMDLIRLREQYGVARRLFKMRTMSSDVRSDPRRVSGLTAYFVGENSAGTESSAAYDSVTLTAKKLMVISRMSNELREDAAINFGDELAGEIGYAFANKEDECAFNGDGTSTYGGIVGIRTQLGTLTAGTAPGLISGAGSTWSSLTLANFESVVGALPQYADVPGQVGWVCHKAFAWTVMKALALAAGGVTADDINRGGGGMVFLGYPVYVSQVFPSTTASAVIPVVFGNLSMAATFGDRRMESIEFSDTATVGGQSVWERDQMAVKGTQRFDINVHDFGSNSVAGPICGLKTT